MFLTSSAVKSLYEFLSSGHISKSPLNGETRIVFPVLNIGKLSEKPPSNHFCHENEQRMSYQVAFESKAIIIRKRKKTVEEETKRPTA